MKFTVRCFFAKKSQNTDGFVSNKKSVSPIDDTLFKNLIS